MSGVCGRLAPRGSPPQASPSQPLRSFGLSESASVLFFGAVELIVGAESLTGGGDMRGIGLAAFGTILVWEGCFPAIRVDPR